MRPGRSRLSGRWRALLKLDDPPWRLALALAVGVFIGCTPFWFFQTALALVVATIFRLNKAATVTGAWLNLPWFAPFVYGAALRVGRALVPGDATVPDAVRRLVADHAALDWREALEILRATSLTLLVGTTIVGAAAAAVTYVVAVRLIVTRRSDDATRPARRRVA